MKRITIAELPRLRKIMHEFAEVSKHPGGFCESHFEGVWKLLLDTDVGVIFYEDDENGNILGVLGSVFSSDMFSGRSLASEAFWAVSLAARGKSLSLRLLSAFEAEAKARKCQQILMVCLTACDPEVVGGILTRRNYAALEIVHAKEI